MTYDGYDDILALIEDLNDAANVESNVKSLKLKSLWQRYSNDVDINAFELDKNIFEMVKEEVERVCGFAFSHYSNNNDESADENYSEEEVEKVIMRLSCLDRSTYEPVT